MALRLAVVVSQAPGLGGTPSAGHRSTAVANASAAASSAMSRSPKRRVRAATTRAHSSWWARVIASRTSITLTRRGTAAARRRGTAVSRPSGCSAFDPSAASLSATSRSGASMIQKPARYSFVSRKGPSVNSASRPVVDDGGRAGRREAAGEDPVTLGLEPVVERVDGSHLVRGGEAGRVVDHGNQVMHLGSSPVVRGAPRGRPLTPATNTSAPIRHRLPMSFKTFWYAGSCVTYDRRFGSTPPVAYCGRPAGR